MEKFNFDVLTPLLDQQVAVFAPDSDTKLTDLTITQVSRGAPHGDEFDAFSVEFKGDKNQHCPQGNYLLKHPGFGEMTLFMSPHAIDSYQVCISRRKND
ncbi:hypothetical protein LZP73_04840 [Shewanella sp. AS16]|uniref:DUF6916 family protein n=1 Tax=Shewanella sp. AS16 TaxID=2907625 RepID=UPI001F26989E|nr:hypothetical protein [Shewanella sp. AS16]MCE9685545.1 hypothetical protein [Shewanella sp. AS16]